MADTLDAETEYLSPDFDPNTLTIPKLRGILVAHNIHYPSSAKKAQLVEIFNENVVPQSRRLLSARARTKRSAKGIVDVPSSQEGPDVDGDSDDNKALPSRDTRTPHRPSKAASRATAEETSPNRASTTGRPKKQSESRKRQSLATPAVKVEEQDAYSRVNDNEGSAFSSENPFQSGSSPIAAQVSRSESRKRSSRSSDKERRKRSSSRRKTEGSADESLTNGAIAASAKAARTGKAAVQDADVITAGEEFTPEEQLELDREEANSVTRIRPARRKKAAKSSSLAKSAPLILSLATLGGFAAVWRQEKVAVGFCGVGRPSTSIGGVDIPEWADAIRPQCEPCPSHAYCFAELKATCEPDFVLVHHPLSLGGLVPIPPTCEPDGEKVRKVKAVVERAVEELRERNADYECGELEDESGQRVQSPEMDEPALKESVASKRRKGMSQEEFEDLWQSAIGELTAREEIVSDTTTISGRRSLRSTSLANISLSCAIRRSVRLTLARHIWKLVTVTTAAIAAFYARTSISNARETEEKAKQLASFALDRLATQAALNAEAPDRHPEAWISMSQLRDDVLRDEFSAKRRQKLWEKVQLKVEDNSNVRSIVREGRKGEIGRAWEWIGALDVLVDGEGNRRQSSRYSFGPSPGSGMYGSSAVKRESDAWDERRPIY